jgi:3-hydroxybutyryl-CoA dehydrogenase
MVAEDRLGRKTGIGFYHYLDGRRQGVAETGDAVAGGRLAPEEIRRRILAAVDAEARDAVAQGVASPEDIDLAMRAGAGHPAGPFERAAVKDSPRD